MFEASFSNKTLYFIYPGSSMHLLFICKVDLCGPTLQSEWRRMCKEKSQRVSAPSESSVINSMLYLIFTSRHLCLIPADPPDKSHPTSARRIESSWGQISRWTWNQFAIKFSCLSRTIRGILITSTLGRGYNRYWHVAPTINFIGNLCLNAVLN